jgi:hypothetical protein
MVACLRKGVSLKPPKLLGQDPLAIDSRQRDVTGFLGWRGSGVETRGNSANMPAYTALGGNFGPDRHRCGLDPTGCQSIQRV